MKFTNEKEIMKVAYLVSNIVPKCCGVTLGGSRALDFNDDLSDVEMYFYSESGIPSVTDINECMKKLGATHKRSTEFLWNEYPWGPHSFFEMDGLYFEIGYRVIGDIEEKIEAYFNGNVSPKQDCHDLGLGYVYSGLAASVCSERVLLAFDDKITDLKLEATKFPPQLEKALKEEYLDTAESLLYGKLLNASKRNDVFFYEVLASRIIRSLMIMAFSVSKTHFPGDKWNEPLLLQTNWVGANKFISLIRHHNSLVDVGRDSLLKKRAILLDAYQMVKEEIE